MRTAAALCSALLLVSCASGGTPQQHGSEETVRVTSGSTVDLGMRLTDGAHRATIAAPLADVWAALPSVLDSLGVPVTMRDPATHRVGNAGYDVRRTLGGTIVSRYFDCGANRGGSAATSYDLFVSVLTTASTVDGGTQLATDVTVKGKPVTYSGAWVNCESVGLLEQRIADGVTARTHH